MQFRTSGATATVIFCVFVCAEASQAAKKGAQGMMSTSGASSKSGASRDFLVSMPLAAERPQLRLHMEYNAGNEAGIALEGGMIGTSEELGTKEVGETGNSMKVSGVQAGLLLSRYSEPTRLGGFFWTLGAGYRQYAAEWKKRPVTQETETRLSTTDDDGYLHHRIVGSGPVGFGRLGYRYVAAEWPIALGGHVGIRHMTSTIKDTDVDQEEQKELKLQYSPTNSTERKSVNNRMMTQPDLTIDLGVVF